MEYNSKSNPFFVTLSSGDLFHFGLLELLDNFPIASSIFVFTKNKIHNEHDIEVWFTNCPSTSSSFVLF